MVDFAATNVFRWRSVSAAWRNRVKDQRNLMWPPNLQLDFARRPLGGAAVRAVAEHLPPNVTQLSLDFSFCSIGDAGAVAVAEHLPPNVTQLSLNFDGCDIGEAGAVAE